MVMSMIERPLDQIPRLRTNSRSMRTHEWPNRLQQVITHP